MTSHEYAENLKRIADFLLSRPAFTTQRSVTEVSFYFYDKTSALAAIPICEAKQQKFDGYSFLMFSASVADQAIVKIGVYKSEAFIRQPVEVEIAPEFRDLGK